MGTWIRFGSACLARCFDVSGIEGEGKHSSDGPQPHSITLEFPCKMAIQVSTIISLFLCSFIEGEVLTTSLHA